MIRNRTGKDSPSRPRRGSTGESATDNADRRYRLSIDKKIEDQTEFVRWSDEKVAGRGRPEKVSGQKLLSVADAEEQTGITKLQVHKWRRRLKDPEKYKALLYGAAYRKARGAH